MENKSKYEELVNVLVDITYNAITKQKKGTYNKNNKRTLVVGEGFAQAKAGLQKHN